MGFRISPQQISAVPVTAMAMPLPVSTSAALMREVVRANGQTARYFDDGGDATRDFLYTWLNTDELIQRIFVDEQSEDIRDLNAGYVAGVNRYLEETGVDNLSAGEEGCRGKSWVRPITVLDLGKLLHKLILRASADPLRDITFAATPTQAVASRGEPVKPAAQQQLFAQLASRSPEELALHLDLPEVQEMGSNGYGIGADASQSGRGLVLSNTHFAWQGNLRWANVARDHTRGIRCLRRRPGRHTHAGDGR